MKKLNMNSLKGLNRRSIRKKQFPIRLNEYYTTALKILANPEEGLSMQKIVRGILEKEIDRLLRIRFSEKVE